MLAAALVGIVVAAALALVRALKGPTIFDRLVAANAIGNAAIVFLAVLGLLDGRPDFLDIALVYALLNVIGVFAVLKFFRYGPLGGSGEEGEGACPSPKSSPWPARSSPLPAASSW
jgi:multicomponent Na+:H+ antiporter subunit F